MRSTLILLLFSFKCFLLHRLIFRNIAGINTNSDYACSLFTHRIHSFPLNLVDFNSTNVWQICEVFRLVTVAINVVDLIVIIKVISIEQARQEHKSRQWIYNNRLCVCVIRTKTISVVQNLTPIKYWDCDLIQHGFAFIRALFGPMFIYNMEIGLAIASCQNKWFIYNWIYAICIRRVCVCVCIEWWYRSIDRYKRML